MKKLLISIAALALLVVGATMAKADPIAFWEYKADAVFVSWINDNNATGSVGSNNTGITGVGGAVTLDYTYHNGQPNPGSVTGYRELTWGKTPHPIWGMLAPQPGSSVSLGSSSGVVYTNGADVNGVTLSHINKSIDSSYRTLNSGTVFLTLELKPEGAPTGETYSITMSFDFFETPNNSSATERDIFIVMDSYKSVEKFRVGDYEYDFTFEASFQPLTGWYLEYAQNQLGVGPDTVLYGWTTAENATTTFETLMRVRHEYIGRPANPSATPEPATILLMGAGLAGLGFMARRRKQR